VFNSALGSTGVFASAGIYTDKVAGNMECCIRTAGYQIFRYTSTIRPVRIRSGTATSTAYETPAPWPEQLIILGKSDIRWGQRVQFLCDRLACATLHDAAGTHGRSRRDGTYTDKVAVTGNAVSSAAGIRSGVRQQINWRRRFNLGNATLANYGDNSVGRACNDDVLLLGSRHGNVRRPASSGAVASGFCG